MNSISGLVIKEPWIDLILSGKKTWEIRGTRTKTKTNVALIKSGSGRIIGTCDIVGCLGPFLLDDLKASKQLHCVPDDQLQIVNYRKIYAWVISNARGLEDPIEYQHPSGAVIWVDLNETNVPQFRRLEDAISGRAAGAAGQKSRAEVIRACPLPRIPTVPARRAVRARRSRRPRRGIPSSRRDALCKSFCIIHEDGTELFPSRMRNRATGAFMFRVSNAGNTLLDAIQVDDEEELYNYARAGYRVRCTRRDGTRPGLFSGRSPNRIKKL